MHSKSTGADSGPPERMRNSGEPKVATGLLTVLACLGTAGVQTSLAGEESISIPLQHDNGGEGDHTGDYFRLGIMLGINDSEPRLYMFDTGSDQLNAEIDPSTPGVRPVPGSTPEMYAYGDGTYGDWVQRLQITPAPDRPSAGWHGLPGWCEIASFTL